MREQDVEGIVIDGIVETNISALRSSKFSVSVLKKRDKSYFKLDALY